MTCLICNYVISQYYLLHFLLYILPICEFFNFCLFLCLLLPSHPCCAWLASILGSNMIFPVNPMTHLQTSTENWWQNMHHTDVAHSYWNVEYASIACVCMLIHYMHTQLLTCLFYWQLPISCNVIMTNFTLHFVNNSPLNVDTNTTNNSTNISSLFPAHPSSSFSSHINTSSTSSSPFNLTTVRSGHPSSSSSTHHFCSGHHTVPIYNPELDLSPGIAGYRISNPSIMAVCPIRASLDVSWSKLKVEDVLKFNTALFLMYRSALLYHSKSDDKFMLFGIAYNWTEL